MRLHSPPNRSSQSAPMPITHLFAGVAVSDFAAARRWYEALFGRSPDILPKEGEAVWHVTTFGSVYVTADPARAGSALVVLIRPARGRQAGTGLFARTDHWKDTRGRG